jgi:hypothetical protein
MNLDLGSFAFGTYLNAGTGTPSWGTALGQSKPAYKFTYPGAEIILIGMIYCSVPLNRVSLPLGKGGRIYQASELDECQIASLFRKVYINGIRIDYPFVMVLVKEDSDSHSGRKSIKYSDKNAYKYNEEKYSNTEFIQHARKILGLEEEACWFIYNFEIYNQDELHMSAIIVDKDSSIEYENSSERRNAWMELIDVEKGDFVRKKECDGGVNYLQRIYFGTPGSGKSWTIKKNYEQDERKVFRTTFHPDTDYASFVGCYKPVKDEDDDMKIVYEFVPQAFTDAYVAAWCDIEHPYYLIIEEINRGNCAQIFGDLFQLLDRNKDGYSEYPIKADHDLADYLMEHLPEDSEGIRDGKLCLPPNLSIIASMNTSDQSLFPMDSAFKRRWSWEYVPIDYENIESDAFTITIGEDTYNWHEFLKAVNKKIKAVTSSEDKQMGNFFIKSSIDEKEFCDKVMFYLWSEVGKDNYQTNDAIFRYYAEEDKLKEFSFNELYDQTKRTDILKGFIRYIEEEK